MSNTRICVKQLPKHLTDKRFKEHFEKFGTVTDAKIIKKDGKSRLFGFIGFSTEQSAKNALSLNGTFIDTSKIVVETATVASETTENRPWSKYSIGSSSNKRLTEMEKEKEKKELKRKQDKLEQQSNKKQKKSHTNSLLDAELENDPEYQEFLNLVAPQANRKVWENDDKEIGKINRGEEEGEEGEENDNQVEDGKLPFSGKKKIELDHGKNKDLLVFEDADASDEEDLYEDMPTAPKKQNKKDDVDSIINEKKKKHDSSVSDLDWLSKFRSNNDEIIEKNQSIVYRDEEESEEEDVNNKENKKDKMKIDDNKENKKEKKKDKKKNKKDNDNDGDDDESKIKPIKYFEHDYTKEDEDVGESGRIFVRNLSYSTKEEDLEKVFSKFGKISEIHIPIDYDSKKSKGIAFILYLIPENAVQALNDMDGKVFQGRLIHVLPGKAAPAKQFSENKDNNNNGAEGGSSSFKAEKEQKQKTTSGSTHNWNALFMRSDAIVSSLAERYKMTQGQLLDPNQMDLAVRMTLMETHVINETKKFLEDQGVIIQDIGNKGSKRSNTVLLVKNIPFKTQEHELHELFSKFGELSRVVLSPARTIALIEYIHPNEAKVGFKNLAYSKFHHVPLYLEWAPEGVFKLPAPPKEIKKSEKSEKSSDSSNDKKEVESTTKTAATTTTTKKGTDNNTQFVYIKNLNWKTTNETLVGKFKSLKDYVNVNIATKANPKNPSERLPCGFGFIEFSSKQGAYECIKKLNGSSIDGYEISLKLSDKNETNVQEINKRRELPENSKQSIKSNGGQPNKPSSKIIIKNLPFESTIKEIRKLFTAYGEIQSVRIPKKPNGGHRGFGFVEFLTEEEAKNAMEALGNSHFYGRHLVLQYAEQDKNIDELREKANLDYEKIKNSTF
ncbi:RNA-binding region RNP-1 domain-containing protein [Dictyostelium discoideum AX4]|uniref:Multiple RNA-binding domain-containing protein 1 n=1 Tax=Dictyostelium discoideum TaxID=44689 RepID=MRD1_DICDI|nr:RNA-binding region RNP-1 domain-containing protein [Dictyostelium discoideum AX4]Q54PB2.1 RecName: Full=Multiple RNA-binding domain-containing protein 1; AltName: Full=RNA-binding motif protein 19 homolog; AltName: Full=RNA-binding protein 19 homolog [Dictyostelium discoideum]EAL65101.1 RNA-binding region RNP-1 domain-containing protein [Dictyostelium discoideum AX4]|eukprot:XP_638463.1 RNA-binding region RNP-1 domain-containing protein [Dictyostelium discoideum AX4]